MTASLEHQVGELRLRVERVEAEARELRDGLTTLSKEHAITRESVRIFTELVDDVRAELGATRADVHQVQLALQQHMVDEARDRRRQFSAQVAAIAGTTGTLAVLLWEVTRSGV
ncbi:hypothetical protein [Marichromatium sp. AB31]|uniref:hypothetical protein n=1 Tax=Marichromatium sp. AB31 TaxID=2483362 RepID=UPI000F3EF414|nr:hypothetical protein [Marichromatium sp. AB31]RNE89865.1 hypothetical protein EBL84_09255 [Marichromatium sp. AB31]